MHVSLWTLQAILALLYLAGGAYKTFASADLVTHMPALPRGAWAVLGVVEMAGAVLLVVPAAAKWQPSLTPLAATVLAVETLVLAAFYARYSRDVAATNPLMWAAAMALLVGVVAYGRYALRPLS